MAQDYALQLMPTVRVREEDEETLLVQPTGAALRFKRPGRALRALLERLRQGGMDRDAICDEATVVAEESGAGELGRLYFALAEMERKGMLRYTLMWCGQALATLEPLAPAFRLEAMDVAGRFLLSRFACLRRVGDSMMLESPLGHARVVIHDRRGTALLGMLATPHGVADLAAAVPECDGGTIAAFLSLLGNAKAMSAWAEDGGSGEDESVALRQWEFHDLLFHARSRLGRHGSAYGGNFRFLDALPPLPAVRPPRPTPRIALYAPDLHAPAADDVSFTHVTEARRSVRTPAEQPLSAAKLGEFLYRSARIKQVYPAIDDSPYEVSTRPCASGGAMHELELYLTLSRCDGIEPGFYRYDPLAHELEHVSDLGPLQKRLIDDARLSSASDVPPDALITIAARFQRVAWKYQSIAYAVILKNTGALYQQMYLVATALNLAPCGLGGGDSDLFAEAAGVDYYAETSVGEFMLSSR